MKEAYRREGPIPALMRWKPFFVSFPILFTLMTIWALASPLMSSPDEPAHAIRAAAVVRGDLTGTLSTVEPGSSESIVPRYIAKSHDLTCYRYKNQEPASCQQLVVERPNDLVPGYTTATLNTPVFYAVTGLPTLFLDGNKAFYAMRAVVALVCAGLLSIAFMAVRQLFSGGRWATVATAVSVTPMVLFLSGSINPNAVEISAAAATLALLVLVFRTESAGRTLWERLGLLTVSVFALVNTRSLSLFWLLLLCVVALLVAKGDVIRTVFSRPIAWVATAIMGVASLAAFWWYLVPKGLTQEFTSVGVGTSWGTAFLTSLDRTFDLAYGWIGVFGWLDTDAPGFTLIVWVLATGVLVTSAFMFSRRGPRLALALLGAVILLLPLFIQAALATDWGYVWQGRYTLAPFVCMVILAGIILDEFVVQRPTWQLSRAVSYTLVLLVAAHVVAFVWVLRRYVIGLTWDETWVDMFTRPEWQPPLGWLTLSIAFTVVLAAGAYVLSRVQPTVVGSQTAVGNTTVTHKS